MCGLFQFYQELAGVKKSQDDNEAFNLYDFCLYGLCCDVVHDVHKAEHMKLAVEGNISAALFHGIVYIVPSDYANDDCAEGRSTSYHNNP